MYNFGESRESRERRERRERESIERQNLKLTQKKLELEIENLQNSKNQQSNIDKSKNSNEKVKIPFKFCPYCGEKLNLPKTPRFCPYCKKQMTYRNVGSFINTE
jgi:rubrerythrin